jgi:hypothetical protein
MLENLMEQDNLAEIREDMRIKSEWFLVNYDVNKTELAKVRVQLRALTEMPRTYGFLTNGTDVQVFLDEKVVTWNLVYNGCQQICELGHCKVQQVVQNLMNSQWTGPRSHS